MSSRLNHKPHNPERMVIISAFQKMVLDKTSGEAIVGQDDTNIRPEFDSTGINKIILHPMRKGIISFISKIPMLFFLLKCLLKMYNICKLTSGTVLVHRIIDVNKMVALKVLLIFVAIHFGCRFLSQVIKGILISMVSQSWIEKVKKNPRQGHFVQTKDHLVQYNSWWESPEGAAVHKRIAEGFTELINSTVLLQAVISMGGFAKAHFEEMSSAQLSNRIHLWDNRVMEMLDGPTGEVYLKNPTLDGKRICRECYIHITDHTDKAIDLYKRTNLLSIQTYRYSVEMR